MNLARVLLAWHLLLVTATAGELRFEWSPMPLVSEGQCTKVREWAQGFQDRRNQVYGLCVETTEAPATGPGPLAPSSREK